LRYDTPYNAHIASTTDSSHIDLMTELAAPPALTRLELPSTTLQAKFDGCFIDTATLKQHCLAPWTLYRVYVAPVFTTSLGTPLAVLVQTQPGSIPAVAQVVQLESSASSITLQWQVVLPLQGLVDAFEISAGLAGTVLVPNTRSLSEQASNPIYTHTLTDLYSYSTYTVAVRGVRSSVPGNYSNPATLTTAEAVPSKMPAPVVASADDSTVTVSWTAPQPLPGAILAYDVCVGYESDQSPGQIVYSGLALTATLSTLRGTDFRVRATTAAGTGPWSNAASQQAQSVPSSLIAKPEAYSAVIVVTVVAIVLVALSVYWYRQKRAHDRALITFTAPAVDEWEYDPANLQMGQELGKGSFGVVLAATTTKAIQPDLPDQLSVAVKMCKVNTTAEDKINFVAECNLMKRFAKPWHPNVTTTSTDIQPSHVSMFLMCR
jgi:hypothetical protein